MTQNRIRSSAVVSSELISGLLLGLGLISSLSTPGAYALDQITRPYQSVRSAGMGGVRITTGLYDENFFNNPARVTANPTSKLTLFQMTPIETTLSTITSASSILGASDFSRAATGAIGTNLHDRFQLILPAYYLASNETRKWALAIGMITSVQADIDLRQSYQTDSDLLADMGVALTFGYKLLPEDALSLGFTGHLIYRVGASPVYSMLDYIRGTALSIANIGGEGMMVDFDLGGTYRITRWGDFDVNVAAAVQNLMGGTYSNLPLKLFNIRSAPPAQNRSLGIGASLYRAAWGNFSDTYFALEGTDILNNLNGSLFRLIHIGAETHWRSIAVRLGLNQGYWAAGMGFDFGLFALDLASYGEEMGLNAGTLEDRRYTLNFGVHF